MLQLQNLSIKPSKVRVRTFTNIIISFGLNQALSRNSSLSLRFRGGRNNKNDWYYLQSYDPNLKGYIHTNLDQHCHVLPILVTGKDLMIQYRILEKRGIYANQPFIFEIHETLVQSIVEEEKKIEILVKQPGKDLISLKLNENINVFHEEKDHFTIICPSIINTKETFEALIRVEDKYYNLVKNFSGEIKIFKKKSESKPELIGSYKYEKNNEGILRVNNISFSSPDIYYIMVEFESVNYQSNPILCKKDKLKKRLFWGYIHGHTNKSDGIRDPHEYYSNLINAGLDFGTSTEHDHIWETTEQDFDEIREVAETHNRKGHFITLFGYEWGYWYTQGYGDICIYHEHNSIPILRSDTNKFNSTPKLIKNLLPYKQNMLMIGHHTALRPGYRNWKHFNNQLEKLVEIYSTWGNQEYSFRDGNPLPPRYKFFSYGKYAKNRGPVLEKKGSFVQDALKQGYKLGFTAGGDDHFGIYPSGPLDPDNGIYPSGIMAIWAEELSRDSLWQALHNRSCYGTTGPRVIIEFSLDDNIMGEIIDLNYSKNLSNDRFIELRIISPIKIVKIELIRNNIIFKEIRIENKACEKSIQDSDNFYEIALKTLQNEKFLFYYLRIFLEHNNMAWSSPIWIILK